MSQLTADEIANDVAACEKAIVNALDSSPIMTALAKQGYNAAKMQKGLDAARALQTGQAATGTTLGVQADATDTVVSSFKSSRSELVLLRDKGREIYATTDQAAWTALKLGEQVPRGQNKFVTFGTDTIQNVLKNPIVLAALVPEGYDEARLNAILATVQAAATSDQTQEATKGTRRGSTGVRDSAETTFRKWWTPFKKAARRLLTPAELTTLGL